MISESDSKDLKRNQELLDSAISKLEIQSVLVRESKTFVRDNFAPSDEELNDYITQTFAKPTQSGDSNDSLQYGFKIMAGIRLIHKDDIEHARESDSTDFICAEIRTHFVALYDAKESLSKDEENIFHQKNAIFNVWPYWREFVQQMGWRMGAPYFHVKLLKQRNLVNPKHQPKK
ncbi:hypothetical protein [Marinobacter sp. AC-23]|uniref:hypothetical protein n=1 Tax=Marinobacter sp. AC-23 TaxID=1879031 RepID=UPI0008DCD352|nr:hypothetical protein [Marinobacter sp. AC-23]OHY78744.1 hypothetical protein BCA33_17580 [Marinobacter sp. AC-23]